MTLVKKIAFAWMLSISIFSCRQATKPTEQKKVPVVVKINEDSLQQTAAKTWLVKNIEDYFTNFDKLKGDYSALCTKEYAAFKTDATNVGLDGGMTEDKFKQKWGRRYSPYAGIGEGFLVGGSDFVKIKVDSCDFINKTEMGGWLFKTVLTDTLFKSKFLRDIIVVKNGNGFLIDNVLEKGDVYDDRY